MHIYSYIYIHIQVNKKTRCIFGGKKHGWPARGTSQPHVYIFRVISSSQAVFNFYVPPTPSWKDIQVLLGSICAGSVSQECPHSHLELHLWHFKSSCTRSLHRQVWQSATLLGSAREAKNIHITLYYQSLPILILCDLHSSQTQCIIVHLPSFFASVLPSLRQWPATTPPAVDRAAVPWRQRVALELTWRSSRGRYCLDCLEV